MKERWFSFKVLSRASSPRNFLVFVSLEEKEGANNPWDVSVREESSPKIPKNKYASQVSEFCLGLKWGKKSLHRIDRGKKNQLWAFATATGIL